MLQMSMPTLDPQRLYELGRRLAPLRDEGTLIVGSGFTTHNLAWFDPSAPASGDLDALLDFECVAPAADVAHPRTEHWAPLYVALGAAEVSGGAARTTVDGFWYGLSKRSWQLS